MKTVIIYLETSLISWKVHSEFRNIGINLETSLLTWRIWVRLGAGVRVRVWVNELGNIANKLQSFYLEQFLLGYITFSFDNSILTWKPATYLGTVSKLILMVSSSK